MNVILAKHNLLPRFLLGVAVRALPLRFRLAPAPAARPRTDSLGSRQAARARLLIARSARELS